MKIVCVIFGATGYLGANIFDNLKKNSNIEVIASSLDHFNDVDLLRKLIQYKEAGMTIKVLLGSSPRMHNCYDQAIPATYLKKLKELINLYTSIIKPDQIVYLSSCSVYGDVGGIVEETEDLKPLSPYADLKARSEELVLHSAWGSSVLILRLPTLYGLNCRKILRYDTTVNAMMSSSIIDRIITIPEITLWRPIANVNDIAGIVSNIVCESVAFPSLINIGRQEEVFTLQMIANIMSECINKQISVKLTSCHDYRSYRPSFNLMKSIISYTFDYDIQVSLGEVIDVLHGGVL